MGFYLFYERGCLTFEFRSKCNKHPRRRLSGGRRKSVSFEDLSSRRLFRPCRILPIRLVDLRYTLPSLIISLIRFGSFYETLVLRFTFIHSFLCSIITFYPSSFLPSSPTWLHPPSPSNFSRYSYSLTRVLFRFCYCFVVQTGKTSVFLVVLSLWCLFITWDLNFH